MLDFILLILDVDFFPGQLGLLAFDDLSVPRHLLLELLLQPVHQGIHHFVAAQFDFELAAEFAHFALQALLLLSTRLVLVLDKCTELLILGKQGSNRLIFLSQGPADLLNALDHLADLFLLIRDVLLNRL